MSNIKNIKVANRLLYCYEINTKTSTNAYARKIIFPSLITISALSIHNGLKRFELTDSKQQWCLEQPCTTMEACKRLQRRVNSPIKVGQFLLLFFVKKLEGNSLFMGPVISLFWTSDDVCLGFKSQSGSFACMLPRLNAMDS